MESDPKASYTNGEPFLITWQESVGEASRRIHYLLPDGTRKSVVVALADDTEEYRNKIGEALATQKVGYGH